MGVRCQRLGAGAINAPSGSPSAQRPRGRLLLATQSRWVTFLALVEGSGAPSPGLRPPTPRGYPRKGRRNTRRNWSLAELEYPVSCESDGELFEGEHKEAPTELLWTRRRDRICTCERIVKYQQQARYKVGGPQSHAGLLPYTAPRKGAALFCSPKV